MYSTINTNINSMLNDVYINYKTVIFIKISFHFHKPIFISQKQIWGFLLLFLILFLMKHCSIADMVTKN